MRPKAQPHAVVVMFWLCGQRRVLFGYNFVFALCSIYVLMLGIVLNLAVSKFSEEFPGEHIVINGILLIVMGALMLIVSFVGWWGAFFEAPTALIAYAALLVVFAVLQLIMVIVDLENVEVFQTYSDRVIHERWRGRLTHMKFWNNIQRSRRCCGLDEPEDWADALPASCCERYVRCTLRRAFADGCAPVFRQFVESLGSRLAISFIVVIVGELVGATLAVVQTLKVRNELAVARQLVPDWR